MTEAALKLETPEDLLNAILKEAATAAGSKWEKVKDDVESDLKFIAERAIKIQLMLKTDQITTSQADLKLHLLELALNNTLSEIKVLTYVVAQSILNAVVKVVLASIKANTGVDLSFLTE